MSSRALTLICALALTPFAAEASGSWAVPRFTPTWAELQRDLQALGFKKPAPVKKRPPVVRKKVEPTKVAEGTKTDTGKTGAEGVKTTDTTTGDQRMVDSRNVSPPYGTCSAYCIPMPVCVESSPLKEAPQQQPQPLQNVTPPQSEMEPKEVTPEKKETVTATEEKTPADKAGGDKDKKGASKKGKSTGKTGRPKADDKADEGQLKKKKYWWQDQQ